MRGDFRLDFVAKSLALTGLGLVGAIGALIDYWPAALDFPSVHSVNVRRLNPTVRTLVDLRGLDTVTDEPMPAVMSDARHTNFMRPVGAPSEPRLFTEEWIEDTTRSSVSAPPALPARLPVHEVSISAALPSFQLAADDAGAATMSLAARPAMMPVAVASDRSEDGFFSGVLKKTGSSVGTSLGKASNSVVGAVRVVGDVVKRAF